MYETKLKIAYIKKHVYKERKETTIIMHSVPFRPERMEFLVPVYNPELEYPLFHLGSKSSQFRAILVIPVCFDKYRPKLKI